MNLVQRQAAVAVVALALFGATFALMIYAGQRMYTTIGPSRAFAAADGRLYLLSHGSIHVFGKDGHRIESYDLAGLGVNPRPSDFEVHRDGSILTTDPDSSLLNRCKVPAGPCEQVDLGLRKAVGQDVLPLNPLKLHIDEDSQRYYVSDNAGHQVVIADFTGHVLARSTPYQIAYPNQLGVPSQGRLSVVDTGHSRIVTFDVAKPGFDHPVDAMTTGAIAVARPGRHVAFDSVVLPNGQTWVLIGLNHCRDSDVVVFEGGKPLRRLDLGDDSDPFDIELWNDRVIVADATNYRVAAFDFSGNRIEPFADEKFRGELVQAKQAPAFWGRVRLGARAGLVIIPLAVAFLLWALTRKSRRNL